MRYFHFPNFELLFRCISVVIFCYALVIAVIDISIFYALLPVSLYFLVSFISISPPEIHITSEVLGENRRTLLRQFGSNKTNCQKTLFPCIAYQVASLDSADDTLNAIKLCWRNGCRFIHVDARLTSDNVAVIIRQKNLVCKNTNSILGKCIEESSYLDLSASHSHSENSGNIEEPSTLEDVVRLCKVLGCNLMINVIHSSYYRSLDSTVDILLKLYEKDSDLIKQCIISSTNPWLLYKIRRRNKDIAVALQWESLTTSLIPTVSWLKRVPYGCSFQRCLLEIIDDLLLFILRNFTYVIVGISAVILPKHLITPSVVEYWESKHVRCIAAIVNLNSEKQYYEHGLGIIYLTETVA